MGTTKETKYHLFAALVGTVFWLNTIGFVIGYFSDNRSVESKEDSVLVRKLKNLEYK